MRTAQIVSSAGSPCALSPASRKYTIAFTSVTSFDSQGDPVFTPNGLETDAVNLIEYTGGTLGGSVSGGDPSCPIELNPTPIPAGTNVMVSKIANATPDNTAMYGFALPNDLCVDCCDEGNLNATQSQQIPVVRSPNDILSAMLID